MFFGVRLFIFSLTCVVLLYLVYDFLIYYHIYIYYIFTLMLASYFGFNYYTNFSKLWFTMFFVLFWGCMYIFSDNTLVYNYLYFEL